MCGFNNCKFNCNNQCMHESGGGIKYGLDKLGRKLHNTQPIEIRLHCRCCMPDIGQHNLVGRLIKLAEDFDAYDFYDGFESMEECEKQTEMILKTKKGVESLIIFCEKILDENEEVLLNLEAADLRSVLIDMLGLM